MQFMGISVGILALIVALVLLFGFRGARLIVVTVIASAVAVAIAAFIFTRLPMPSRDQKQSAQEDNDAAALVTPLQILSAGSPDSTPELSDKIRVRGPDKRIFVFLSGTAESSINSYMQSQYGAPGTARAECWSKSPGPWCAYR